MMVIATILVSGFYAYNKKRIYDPIPLPLYSKHRVEAIETFPYNFAKITLNLGDRFMPVNVPEDYLSLELVLEARNGLPERRIPITAIDLLENGSFQNPQAPSQHYTDGMPKIFTDTIIIRG